MSCTRHLLQDFRFLCFSGAICSCPAGFVGEPLTACRQTRERSGNVIGQSRDFTKLFFGPKLFGKIFFHKFWTNFRPKKLFEIF
jgi:hypothetical protein